MTQTSVSLQIPADNAFVSLVRAATLGFVSRLEFPIDQLDEISHAAHEMTTLLLADTATGNHIDIEFDTPDSETVSIVAKSTTIRGKTPRTDSFAWMIITALVDSATATVADGEVVLAATRRIQHFDSNKPVPANGSGSAISPTVTR